MTTKERILFLKNQSSVNGNSLFNQNEQQYFNLNLNQNYKDTCLSPVQSQSISIMNKQQIAASKITDTKFTQDNMNKSCNKSWTSESERRNEFYQKTFFGEQQHCSNSIKNSTLSLHITAYENSIEAQNNNKNVDSFGKNKSSKTKSNLTKKWKDKKQLFSDSIFVAQNSFELPRQQEGDKIDNPEVMQFKASQKILNPNESFERKKDKRTRLKERMLNARTSCNPNKSEVIKESVEVQLPQDLPASVKIRTDDGTIPAKKRKTDNNSDSEDEICPAKKRKIDAGQQLRMQQNVNHKRELDAHKKVALSNRMKNTRSVRTMKNLKQKLSQNTVLPSQNTVLPSKPQLDFFNPNDDFLECIISSDNDNEASVESLQQKPMVSQASLSIPIPSSSSSPLPSSKSPKTLKSPQEISKSGYFKRKKDADKIVCEMLGPGHKVVVDQPKKVTVEAAAEYYVLHGCKDAQYSGLDRRFYPCLTTVKNYLKQLKENLKNLAKDGLADAILNDLNSMKEFPFEKARLNIGVDQGKDTSKIVYSWVDLKNPQSPKKLRVYKVILGKDNRQNLLPHLLLVDEAAAYLQSKTFETKHGPKTFECFFIADCKAGDETVGLQGGSATCPCIYCSIASKHWKDFEVIPDSYLRSIEELVAAGEAIEAAEADPSKTEAQIRQLKIRLKSVKATPMMRSIPLKRFVPPVVHIGIKAVSATAKKSSSGFRLLAVIEQLGIKYHQGTSDFTGPNCRKILKYLVDNSHINGFGIDLLRAYSKIEKFAEARDLSEEEIDEMDQSIKDYFALMDVNYPDFAGTSTKIHVLRHHVMPFVRAYKSWGKFSEQGLESIHKVKNQTDLRIKSGNSQAKIEYFMSMQMLTNYFYKDKPDKSSSSR